MNYLRSYLIFFYFIEKIRYKLQIISYDRVLLFYREIKQKIQQAEQEAIDSNEAYNSSKQKHKVANEAYLNKQREWRSITSKIKRLEDDANLVKKEIQKLER